MKKGANPQPEGRIRRSQLVNSFGPGALVDLPEHSVIIGGLDTWGDPDSNPAFQIIHEPRLLNKVVQALEMPGARLVSPPIDLGRAIPVRSGITAWQFPEWFVVQKEEASGPDRRSRRLPLLPPLRARARAAGELRDRGSNRAGWTDVGVRLRATGVAVRIAAVGRIGCSEERKGLPC